MKYIDKTTNSAAANQIVDSLLTNCWNEEETCYLGADYEGLSQTQYRDPIVASMLKEQSNLCCYCLKEIHNGDTTLEHIIPHNVKEADFQNYLLVDELTNNVIYKNGFNLNVKHIPPAKYPHDIAYHNLIASCNNNSNCNHYRKSKFIYPFIYDPNIESKVEYDSEGIAFSAEYLDALAATGISTNPLLKIYRKIWKILSAEKNESNEVTNDDIELTILTLEGDTKFTQLLSNFYDNPSKKDDLLKYKWFFDYYKNN